MEIKFELDTEKAGKDAVAIAISKGLCSVSHHTDRPQLAAANAIAIIIVVAILYGQRASTKPSQK